MHKVEFNDAGLYYCTCLVCADDRAVQLDNHPTWLPNVDCKACNSSGDLCTTLLIEDDSTPEQIESMLADFLK